MAPVPDGASARNRPPLSVLLTRCAALGATDEPSLRELAREALAAAGFSLARPSFRTHGARNGAAAIVELTGDIAIEERIALAVDALSEAFRVFRLERQILVLPGAICLGVTS